MSYEVAVFSEMAKDPSCWSCGPREKPSVLDNRIVLFDEIGPERRISPNSLL